MKAGCYVRISHDPLGQSESTQRQEADARTLCATRGWTVAAIYRDTDASAFDRRTRRPEFERMVADVTSGQIDVVIVWKVDRLTRQSRDLERFLDACETHRVALVSITEPFDVGNSMGLFMLRQMVNMANLASAQTGERVKRAAEQLAKDGKPFRGGLRPFGWEPDGITPREDEAELLREACERLLAGESLYAVTTDLQARGVLGTKGQSPISRRALKDALISPRNAGLRSYHGEVVAEAVWPALLPRDDWERLRAMLTDPSRAPKRGGSSLLTGVLFCGRCEAKMTATLRHARHGKKVPVYRCPPGRERPGCGAMSIQREPLDDYMARAVIDVLDGPGLGKAMGDDPTGELVGKVAGWEAQLEQVAIDHYSGDTDRAQFLAVSKHLRGLIDQARGQIAAVSGRNAALRMAGVAGESWPGWGMSQRRAAVRSVVERIVVAPAVRRTGFDPDRLTVEWRS